MLIAVHTRTGHNTGNSYLSICLPIQYIPTYLSVYLFKYQSIYLSIRSSIYLTIQQSISIGLCVHRCLSIHPSIYLSIYTDTYHVRESFYHSVPHGTMSKASYWRSFRPRQGVGQWLGDPVKNVLLPQS